MLEKEEKRKVVEVKEWKLELNIFRVLLNLIGVEDLVVLVVKKVIIDVVGVRDCVNIIKK